ncbi:class I SAM-dependent methyltransferase [Paraliomyxa miuraensis]|uniref:class I SAM-dependent methyltransferase n=1 Tax=Paraliomyxa miuraensis TaxID=376150 RepID=UPI0022531F27|nr:class I SAM-dependent methyltransferase [Paraliomyxa miuraensis]MCX4243504.1 class I SAM-dependent methyltransferase [Paraliomyxa miuraensis]
MTAPRRFTDRDFDEAYQRVILGNNFFEEPEYYLRDKPRYRRTLDYIARIDLPRPSKILEIGGGQIALLSHELFGDQCTLADVGEGYADAATRFGLGFVVCDLAHDDLEFQEELDMVVLLEVIEHMAIPPHLVLEKIARWIKPGGYIFLTTPNLYRLRNSIRLFLGMPVFHNFFYPERGESLGHPIEYSAEHLRFQMERAGLEVQYVELAQLQNSGATPLTKIGRKVLAPLQKRPLWRDSLVALARKPR